ncbi:MAG TPA: UDP-2,3-diacylglucosamine diphosphatase [Gemmatimonadales bacterium]|nr:UDP-2,3-diacylglucosamine diphosphatase [Gemmatimonadales bacterium]
MADVHLGQVPAAVEQAFHAFLGTVPQPGDALLIDGDLFDFWYEYRAVIPRRHFTNVAKLQAVGERGIPITLIGGNHDRWGGDFLSKDLGINYFRGDAELDLVGRRAYVTHGDGLHEQHWSAALLNRFLRSPTTISAFRWIHPDVGHWLVQRLSGRLADTTRDAAVLDRAAVAQREWAQQLLRRRPELGLVIMAHTHRPRYDVLPDGRAYLNPGAFLDGGRYAVVTKDRVELKTFP